MVGTEEVESTMEDWEVNEPRSPGTPVRRYHSKYVTLAERYQ